MWRSLRARPPSLLKTRTRVPQSKNSAGSVTKEYSQLTWYVSKADSNELQKLLRTKGKTRFRLMMSRSIRILTNESTLCLFRRRSIPSSPWNVEPFVGECCRKNGKWPAPNKPAVPRTFGRWLSGPYPFQTEKWPLGSKCGSLCG